MPVFFKIPKNNKKSEIQVQMKKMMDFKRHESQRKMKIIEDYLQIRGDVCTIEKND